MPYIPQPERPQFENAILGHLPTMSEGQLNYVLTRAAHQYIDQHGLSYATLESACSALNEAQAELRRRFTVIYEDEKIALHGDILPECCKLLLERHTKSGS